jgi:hypothetical protein
MRHLAASAPRGSGSNRSRYRQMSSYAQVPSPDSQGSSSSRFGGLGSGFQSPPKLSSYKSLSNITFTPEYFEMYISATKKRLHRFTSFSASPKLPDRHISEGTTINSGTWAPMGYALASSTPPSCPVIYAEATIAPSNIPLAPGSELGIEFSIRTDKDYLSAYYSKFECKISFFEQGEFTDSITKSVEYDNGSRMLNCIPLGSQFWARNIRNMTASHNTAQSRLDSLSAVQVISASSMDTFGGGPESGSRERLLVLFWNFRLAPPNVPGETSWHYVHFANRSSLRHMDISTDRLARLYGDDNLSQDDDVDTDDLHVKFEPNDSVHTHNMPVNQFSPLGLDIFSQSYNQPFNPSSHHSFGTDTFLSLPTGITSAFPPLDTHHENDLTGSGLDLGGSSVTVLGLRPFSPTHHSHSLSNTSEPLPFSHTHSHQQHSHHHDGLSTSFDPGIAQHRNHQDLHDTHSASLSQHEHSLSQQQHHDTLPDTSGGALVGASLTASNLFDDPQAVHTWTSASYLPGSTMWDDNTCPAVAGFIDGHHEYLAPADVETHGTATGNMASAAEGDEVMGDGEDDTPSTVTGDVRDPYVDDGSGMPAIYIPGTDLRHEEVNHSHEPTDPSGHIDIDLRLHALHDANGEHHIHLHDDLGNVNDPHAQTATEAGGVDDEEGHFGDAKDRLASLSAAEALQRALGLTREDGQVSC